MYEYSFTVNGADGKKYQLDFNDVEFDYVACRNILPENACLEIIDYIKKESAKKIAIIYGNCQVGKLKRFLLNHKIFTEKYFTVKIPEVCNYLNDTLIGYFQENFWSFCDLLISQRVKKDNRFSPFVATQDLPSRLPESAKIIWIPNVYFDGYFPQNISNEHNTGQNIHQSGFFPSGDKYVDAFLKNGGGAAVRHF